MKPIQHRYDAVLLFDVSDGNPNGDPDSGNLPRLDPESGHGLITDVCLKRKVRNWITAAKGNKSPNEIYVTAQAVLDKKIDAAMEVVGKGEKKAREKNGEKETFDKAVQWMCANYYDIRTFGAVITRKEIGAGQVLGPVQMTFSRSVDRVVPAEHTITRMAVQTEKEAEGQDGGNRTMGRKATIPYGLYRGHVFVNVHAAQKTGFSDDDLGLFWEALGGMFEMDRSAARGLMTMRSVIAFKHENPLGNAPAATLFERVHVSANGNGAPRNFAEYAVTVNETNLPKGVALTRII